MGVRKDIRFILNGEELELTSVGALETLLDFLRLRRRLTGTKEGCAEGDCGACTVLVGRLMDGVLRYESVNACIRFLATLDGCHVVTVEHLASKGLHPVQRAMVEAHGSQCGFCTPGIVMSLYALWMERPAPSKEEIAVALQGNLCRCTGYAPIFKAAQSVGAQTDPLEGERVWVAERLTEMVCDARVEIGGAVLPADVVDLGRVLAEKPEATVVAGATDVGLWVTKHLQDIRPVVFIGHLSELRFVEERGGALWIGAGVSYSEAEEAVARLYPALGAYWKRIAGWQVRNMGTIGGNIANGSPIGDMPPVLIALRARLHLRSAEGTRDMPLEDFFLEYGKQDLEAGEFVEAVELPLPEEHLRFGAYKVSKRRDEDISAVAAGVAVTIREGMVEAVRIAYGGMASVPKRAGGAEAALMGQPFEAASFEAAAVAVAGDFEPLSDWRASAEYRSLVAQNLLRRFWAEQGAAP